MTLPDNLDTLRALSCFAPEVRQLAVTLPGDPLKLSRFGAGRGRAAEVCFAVCRSAAAAHGAGPGGAEVLLIHKDVYPPGAFRVPTGGVEPGETPQAAAVREVYEETGYRAAAPKLLGIIDYTLTYPGLDPAAFMTYIFFIEPAADHPPQVTDPAESIDAFRWLPVAELPAITAQLDALPGEWAAWGRFRAVAHRFMQQAIPAYLTLERTL